MSEELSPPYHPKRTISSSVLYMRNLNPRYLVLATGGTKRIAETYKQDSLIYISDGDQVWVKTGGEQTKDKIWKAVADYNEAQPKDEKKLKWCGGLVYHYPIEDSYHDLDIHMEIQQLGGMRYRRDLSLASIVLIAEYLTPIGGIVVVHFDTDDC